ncbi:MAG: CoA transferase [Candidimonas sp.]|nr:MAG: CoA transferase [Candidimonas sp.]TAM19087.1 MAG: CoA transferase [Candidimonas sp.]TAM80702.1 MAG: CoA transferase [Candidimonas sp.]
MKALENLRVVEFATVGGVPFCSWLFAQHGAQVVRIVNPRQPELGVPVDPIADMGCWGREEWVLDLKSDIGRNAALEQIATADVLLEGFRPGVMERLGLGPEICHQCNTALIYARLVGWSRGGPWAERAGHDINYISMAGVMHAMGSEAVPLNLVADLGGGGMYAAFGIMAALQMRAHTRRGSVVDTAMAAGSLHLLTNVFGRLAHGAWNDKAAANVIDGGVPWYRTYQTADGRYMAVGAIEERFYLTFVKGLGLDADELPSRLNPQAWPQLAVLFSARFQSFDFTHWVNIFELLEACVTPVLTLQEAREHPVNRHMFVEMGKFSVPAAVPQINFL